MDTLLLTSDLFSTVSLQAAALLCVLPVPAKIAGFLHTLRGLDICQILKPSAEMQMKETMFTARTGQQQLDHLSAAVSYRGKQQLTNM